MGAPDDPVAVAVFERGIQTATVAVVLTKNELITLDFTTGASTVVHRFAQKMVSGTLKPDGKVKAYIDDQGSMSSVLVAGDADSEDVLVTDKSASFLFDVGRKPSLFACLADATLVFDLLAGANAAPLCINWTTPPRRVGES